MQDDGSLKLKVETWNTDVNPWEGMEGHEGNMEMQHDKDEK